MNVITHSIEVSGFYKQINCTTVFYSFLYDVETLSRKGMNAIYSLVEIGQRSIRNLCDSDHAKSNATAHEQIPMKYRKRVENTDGESKKNEG